MKALPKKFTESTSQALCDPTVSYTIRPLDNRVLSHIQAVNTEYIKDGATWKPEVDHAGMALDYVGFGLVSLEGLDGWEPETKRAKLGQKSVSRLTDDCLMTIPLVLFQELYAQVQISTMPSAEETEDMDFTQDSSTPNSPDVEVVTETSRVVLMDAAMVSSGSEVESLGIESSTSPQPDAPGCKFPPELEQ